MVEGQARRAGSSSLLSFGFSPAGFSRSLPVTCDGTGQNSRSFPFGFGVSTACCGETWVHRLIAGALEMTFTGRKQLAMLTSHEAAHTSPPARPLHAHPPAAARTPASQYLSQTLRHLSGKPQVLTRPSFSLFHLQDAPGQPSILTSSLTPNSLRHNRLSLRL